MEDTVSRLQYLVEKTLTALEERFEEIKYCNLREAISSQKDVTIILTKLAALTGHLKKLNQEDYLRNLNPTIEEDEQIIAQFIQRHVQQ